MEQTPGFLVLPYSELEKFNLAAKKRRLEHPDDPSFHESYVKDYLAKESRIKAVMVAFSDLEGRFQTLDYDKKYILGHTNGLTFDGSSVRGFARSREADLYLKPDWSSCYHLPADIFGDGKILVFAYVFTNTGETHPSDFRGRLHSLIQTHFTKKKQIVSVAPEIEGILVEGLDAETSYQENVGFKLVSRGGYYHTLPRDDLRLFIDKAAEVQRALGFENEKDHPEVAPSQFELNFKHDDIEVIADQIMLYKLVCRQVAELMGITATFLPKPIMGINGNGMHINISVQSERQNLFYDKTDKNNLSRTGYSFAENIMSYTRDISLILNPSVNSYRRLDPSFEAPNEIKMSPSDRTSMIRIPLADKSQTRIEIRSVAPDANPYLVLYTLLKLGFKLELEGKFTTKPNRRVRVFPATIYDAIRVFKASPVAKDLIGKETARKYARLKESSAHRCPRDLGKTVKRAEVIYHHEVTNQFLWGKF